MTQKTNQPQHFSGAVEMTSDVVVKEGNSAGGALTPGTGVAATFDRLRATRHVRLTLTGFVVDITAALDYGGTKIVDLPDSNLVLLGIEADLEMVKGEVTNGLEAATDITVAIGTAVASNATLSAAMEDVMDAIAYTASDASPAHQIHSHADAALSYPILLSDAAALALFFNLAATITADDALTISGTIDLYFVDVGNVTS